MAVCTSIVKLDTLPEIGDLLEVTIDGNRKALWFFSYADSLQYVNKEVIVEYRRDIYKGEFREFIHTFSIHTTIQTLDKVDEIKLYVDQVDNFANLSFNEIADGEERQGCIVFCTHQEFKSSPNAVWMELIIRDKTMHTAKLRIFDYESKEAELAGHYIVTQMSRSKFGFQSTFVKIMNGECPPNPEIQIAKDYILNYFIKDTVAYKAIQQLNLLAALEQHVDYEMGYGLMRMAMELAMVDSMQNITKDVDLEAIGHAILASYAYITRTSVLSPALNNVFIANQIMWPNRALVLQIMDELAEEHPAEYKVFKSIKSTVNTILEVRKGTVF